ncbi:MAG: hypothetical protein AAGH72_08485 [Verrucomicrobiota bacterium]
MKCGIDQVLRPLAAEISHAADQILDLRAAALEQRNPGQCVHCYYRILGEAPQQRISALQQLRHWIESHLTLVVRDVFAHELERLPVELRESSLESYCYRVMHDFHQDRAYTNSQLEISFEFMGRTTPVAA